MFELTLEQVREVIRDELARAMRSDVAPAKKTRRRRDLRGLQEWISASAADARFGWRNGTARDLFLAGKIIGRNNSPPDARRPSYSVCVASCRKWLGEK